MTPVMFNGGQGRVTRSKPFLFFHQAVARSAETALILDDYKLVKTWAKNQLELFDLSKGPDEERDLFSSRPEKVHELHALMLGFLDEVDAETRKTGSKSEVYEKAKPLLKPATGTTPEGAKPNVLFLAVDDLNDWIERWAATPKPRHPISIG